MEIILDALECLSEHLKHYENNSPNYPWTLDEVDSLFQSFDNSSDDDDDDLPKNRPTVESKELPKRPSKLGRYHYLKINVVMRDCEDFDDAVAKCSDLMPQNPDDNTKYMESWEIV